MSKISGVIQPELTDADVVIIPQNHKDFFDTSNSDDLPVYKKNIISFVPFTSYIRIYR